MSKFMPSDGVQKYTAAEDAVEDSVGSLVDEIDTVVLEVDVELSTASEVVLDADSEEATVVPVDVTMRDDAVVDEGDDSSGSIDFVGEVARSQN